LACAMMAGLRMVILIDSIVGKVVNTIVIKISTKGDNNVL
jgi:hypothetical protein